MKRKLGILVGLFLLIALLASIILLARPARTNSTQSTANMFIITQDGKLTVVSPSSYANFKVVAAGKAATNATSAATNSEKK